MKLRAFLSIVLLCCSFTIVLAQNFWEQTGGPASNVGIEAFGKGNDGYVYTATKNTFFWSSNDGAKWTPSSKIFTVSNTDVIATDSTGNVYFADISNVYASSDHGANWKTIGNAIGATTFYGITVNNKDHLLVGTFDKGIYASTDYGTTWKQSTDGLPELPGVGGLYAIFRIIALNNGTIFALTQGGVVRSTNDGASWVIVGVETLPVGLATSLSSTSSGKIFLATADGLYTSIDNGDTWISQKNMNGLNTKTSRLVATSDLNAEVLMSAVDGLWFSNNDGVSWKKIRDAIPDNAAVAILNEQGKYLEGTDRSGIYFSNNGGDSWSFRNNGLLKSAVTTMAVSNKGYIFAQADEDVFRSSNFGETWHTDDTLTFQKNIRSLAVAPNGTVFAAAYNYGLLTSSDNGLSWGAITGMIGTNKNQLSALTTTASGVIFAGGDNGVVYRSVNNAVSWSIKRNGITQSPITILVSKKDGSLFAVNGDGVFRTINNGDSWDTLLGVPSNVVSMATDSVGTIYVGHSGGVAYSNDNGNTFTNISTITNVIGIAVNSVGTVYALGNNGLFSSTDHGANWKLIDGGLNNLAPINLICDGSNRLYSGTRSDGVFRSMPTAPSSVFSSQQHTPTATFGDNYPNPFGASTTIPYSVAKSSVVELDILDLTGKLITNLVKSYLIEGDYNVTFDAHSLGLASGVYVCRLQCNGVSAIKTISYQRY